MSWPTPWLSNIYLTLPLAVPPALTPRIIVSIPTAGSYGLPPHNRGVLFVLSSSTIIAQWQPSDHYGSKNAPFHPTPPPIWTGPAFPPRCRPRPYGVVGGLSSSTRSNVESARHCIGGRTVIQPPAPAALTYLRPLPMYFGVKGRTPR